ncbi:MAG: hypothetical protein ACQESN_10630 [Thermotogota bacterium]
MSGTSRYMGWEIRYMVDGMSREIYEIVYADHPVDAVKIIKEKYGGQTFRTGPTHTGNKVKSAYQIEQDQRQAAFQQNQKLEAQRTSAKYKAEHDARQQQYQRIREEKDRIRNEQNRIKSERKAAEKARIKAQKQKERKIEALAKTLPEDEKQEYDLQLQALNEAREKFKTEKEKVEFKTAIIPILFLSIFVFIYTSIDIIAQYHEGKLTTFSDIYTGANNIIFLISAPLAIWAFASFPNYIFKPPKDKTTGEKISSTLALLSLIATYIAFKTAFNIVYVLPLGLASIVMLYITFILFKKRLKASLLPFEDEVIIQENKYEKLIKRLQLY